MRVLADDAYPTDDEVQLPLRSETPRLLVVGEPPSQLARLLTLLPDVEVFVMDSLTELADEFDLVIVTDGSVTGVPATSTLWLGAVPGGRAAAPRVAVPEVTTWARHHALSSSDWSGLRVDEVYAGPLLAGATAIASSGNIPLIQARLVDVGYQVIVAFPLETSNWVDLTSFPTFIAQLVDLVIPPERRVGSTACISGLPCRLEARFADPELGAVLPDGSRWPPREAWVPMKDEFAEGYWALGGSELSFVPEVPGIVRTLGRQVDGVLSVVASPTGFVSAATAPRDVDDQGDADGVRVPRPGSVPFTGSLVVLGLMLVTVNAILVWLHRVRWFRSRASWVLASTFVVVAALVAALLRLPVPSPHQQPRQIAIVDERARTLEDQYSALSHVIVTGSGAVAPSVIDDESGWAPRATDLYDGLEIGLGLASASSTDSILVYPQSGRGPTSAEVSALAARARSAGVSIDLVPSEGPVAKAIEVTALHLPARINASSTVEALVTVESAVDASVVLRVAFDDEVLADADVDVSVGANALRVPLQFESASAGELSLTLSVEDQGVIETAVTFVEVVAAPTVLIVGPDPTATDTMASALELQGFSVDVQPALNVPWSLDDWNDVDLLVLLDVSAHSLHSTQLASLEEWVGQRGGGLLLLGGATAFGPGGYLRTPLDDLSPLSSQVPSEAPEVTMLFVIDRSGSMQQAVGDTTRMGIAKEATVEAMTLLGPGSLVGVVVYDESAEVLVPLTPIEEMDVVAQAVAGVRANGGTALHPALVEASTVLQGVESAAIHVVVLTDGMSQPGEFRSAIADLRSLGATISFVGIGSGTDKIQLNDLAAMAGGALHITDDVRALPSILAQEALLASQDLVREGDVDTRRHEPPPPLAQDLPPTGRIGGYVLTEAKPAAEILVSTFEEEPAPLLATWRYGLGRVAAFASHGAGNWTEAWFSGATFAPIWGQFARWATATDVPDALDLTASVDGSTVWVTAHAFDEDGSTAVGRDLVVRVQGPDSVITEAGLPEIRPGTYEASLETREAGTYGVSVRTTLGDVIGDLRVVVGSDAVRSSDTGPLLAMPTLTGGHVLSTAPESDEQSLRTIWRPESVVGPWLLLALVAFLASLVVTYGVPRWSDVVLAQRSLRSRLNRA